MKTVREMKKAIEQMLKLYEETERLEEIDEAASDRAYEKASAICKELTDTIVKVTGGQIDRRTARTMVLGHTDKLIALCNRFM